MMTVKIFILYPLDDLMNRHKMMSLNMRRNIGMHELVLENLSQRRKRERYQKGRQYAYTLLLVHIPYYINKAITIHVFYHPWYRH